MKLETAADVATDALREMILSGELDPGQRLHQEQLSEKLGVSRTPLRSAMTALAKDGLLDYRSNRGFHVREFSLDHIHEVFVIRSALEAEACRIAARNGMKEENLDRLDELVAEGDRILDEGELNIGNLPAYRQFNVDFHRTIIDGSGNGWLADFVARTHNVPLVSDRLILWDDFTILKRSHDDHHRISRSLRAGDGERAAAIMREHVAFAGELLINRLVDDPASTFLRPPKDD